MQLQTVIYEKNNYLSWITLNRPEARNAQTDTMRTEIMQCLEDSRDDDNIRIIIITGAGDKAFSAGFDVNPDNPMVKSLMEAVENKDPVPCAAFLKRLRDPVDKLVGIPVPIICAINGLAYGGGAELASRCDIRVMDSDAMICFSETKLGLMPDWGGGPALARVVGQSIATDLLLTARRVGAEEALSLGIVNRISRKGEALKEALDLARSIARNGPTAVRYALSIIRKTNDLPFDEILELELEKAAALIASGECIHGITAFLTKKEAEFPDIIDK